MTDVPGLSAFISNTTMWDQIINDVSGRHDQIIGLNFYEWLFLRSVAAAWTIGSGYQLNITRDELLNIGFKVIPQ